MKMLWRDAWIDAPRPAPVAGGARVAVEATVPVAPLGAAHGRRFTNPLRKVASFAATDGPGATARKSRSKRAESSYTGDYHLVALLGRVGGRRVIGLAPRSPRCAEWLLVREDFLADAADSFSPADLRAVAARAAAAVAGLDPLALTQTYLHSGMGPPSALRDAFATALGSTERADVSGFTSLIPPAGGGAQGDTSIEVGGAATASESAPPLAILGAGDYVRIEVEPALREASFERAILCDREPQIAALAAAALGFRRATTDPEAAIDSLPRRGLVIVATAHDSHARLAVRALAAGHRVFLEKPAVVTAADLDLLSTAAAEHPGDLEVGFNRRSNPLVEAARRRLARESGPATILGTVREVDIEPDHWYLWANQGTRVAGNLCHWIDQALHLMGPGPEPIEVTVSGRVSSEPTGIDAERAFTIGFGEGSMVSLVMTGRGDSVRGVQELMEVRRGELTIRLDDLWRLHGLRAGRSFRRRTLWRDKGHGRMYTAALGRFMRGEPATYPLADLDRVGRVQIALTELLVSGGRAGSVAELVNRAREREAASG